MSKKKRQQRNIKYIDVQQVIKQSLRVDFALDENEIDMIVKATQHYAPAEINEHIEKIMSGKVPLPIHRPSFILDMEDGTTQHFSFTNHPIILLYDYLIERFNRPFATIYWFAITSSSPQDFYESLKMMKKNPGLLNDEVQG
jgi:hypothetical protein